MWKLWSSIKDLNAPFLFELENEIFLYGMPGKGLMVRGKSHRFSRVASGTWDIFSRDGGHGPSKVRCVQQHQDSSLLASDSIGFSSRRGS